MRIADSTAVRLTTGSAPGRPRQIGQTWVLGSAPNSVGQPQNILLFVDSSTCTSSPSTGSKRSTTSAKSTSVGALIARPRYARAALRAGAVTLIRSQARSCRHLPAPHPLDQRGGTVVAVVGVARGLVRGADPVHHGLAQGRGHDLQPDRETVLLGQPARNRHPGDAGEVRRDRGQVVEVHGQLVVELVAEAEGRGGRRRRDQHVYLLVGSLEV